MNTTESEPITGPGIGWAIGQINKRFEKALTPVKKIELTPEECELVKKEAGEPQPNATEGD